MDIEPLKTIIDLTTDKKDTILYFLSNKLKLLLEDYELIDDEFYLNDKIVCIKKNNLSKDCYGKINCIDEYSDRITVKKNNYNITIDPDKYYIFVKPVKSKNNDRQFYKSLLEKL
jgi:hypothetical protein